MLAATYLRRVFVDGRSFAAGAPALTHVYTVGACGTKPRRGSPAALPGAGVWRHAWGDGAHCPSKAQRGHGAHCPRFLVPLRSPTVNNNLLLVPSYVVRVDAFGVDLRFETARSSSAFNFFGLDSILFSKVQNYSKRGWGSIGGSSPPSPPRSHQNP
jgi:hypothetical protein